MKRLLAFILALSFMVPAACAEGTVPSVHTVTESDVTIHVCSMEETYTMPFYFMDGVEDLPYIRLSDWAEFMVYLNRDFYEDAAYSLSYSEDGDTVMFERENSYYMRADFAENVLMFGDYNGFLHNATDSAMLDLITVSGGDEDGNQALFQRVSGSFYDRLGDTLTLNLKDYHIEMIHQDEGYFVPFQTLGDFLVAPVFRKVVLYNGKDAFLVDSDSLGNEQDGYTDIGEAYYSAEPQERSGTLASFGYWELCLVLDSLYGLKENHDIDSFSQLLWQIGYDEDLLGASAVNADQTLYNFLDFFLDDIHTQFKAYSWMAGKIPTEGMFGVASRKIREDYARYTGERAAVLGEDFEAPSYQEVGNTAYLTLDNFRCSNDTKAYYRASEGELLPNDTIGMIIFAHSRIYREDSPVENVVVDLSCNTGGSVDAAMCLVAWFLRVAPLSVKNTLTGAMSTARYRTDVNINNEYNDGDTVSEKNLYCLISPVSFSAANLTASIFQASGKVTLLGRATSGGSCVVQPLSTAWGTIFNLSGFNRLSFMKNGSFYDIDRGVEPDRVLTRIRTFYDREKLTDIINGLY